MIEIDGSYGGGQLLRTALSLSSVTEKPFKIYNIRGKREQAGLKHQHLTAVHAVQEMCRAEVKGAELGSKYIEFAPHTIIGGKYRFNIGTAGSTTLILQTLLPLCLHADKKCTIRISGGTDNPLAPGSFYCTHVFLHFLKKLGVNCSLTIAKHGFYPKGGGEILFTVDPFEFQNLKEINFTERGNLNKIEVNSVASNELMERQVAERIIKGFKLNFPMNYGHEVSYKTYYVASLSPGCFIHANAHFENFRVGDDVLGEQKKKAEDVGKEMAKKLENLLNAKGIDHFAADQLMIYMALKGKGTILSSQITDHILTNQNVIEKFLDVKFRTIDNLIECGPVV